MSDTEHVIDEQTVYPTRDNSHICTICCRALVEDQDGQHQTGVLMLTWGNKPIAGARRLCGGCVESLRAAMREAIHALQA